MRDRRHAGKYPRADLHGGIHVRALGTRKKTGRAGIGLAAAVLMEATGARRRNVKVGSGLAPAAAHPYCTACGSTTDLTGDHRVPLSKGGMSRLENVQVLCRPCNSSKGSREEDAAFLSSASPNPAPENGEKQEGVRLFF